VCCFDDGLEDVCIDDGLEDVCVEYLWPEDV